MTSFCCADLNPIDLLSESWLLIGDEYPLFLGINVVGLIIGGYTPLAILLGPMMCGIYFCYFRKMEGEPVRFEDLFRGFDCFKDSLIVSLLVLAYGMVLGLVLFMFAGIGIFGAIAAGDTAGPVLIAALGLLFVFGTVLGLTVSIGLAFAYPLIVDRGLPAMEAISTSFAAVRANLAGVIVLMFVIVVMSMVAAAFCVLPLYLISPITMGASALAYRRVFA